MNRIIYSSQAVYDFSPDDLVGLLEGARRRNAAVDVTGMLVHCSQSFLQLLEGEADALEGIYADISADERHTNLRLLKHDTVNERLFADWSMGFEHLESDELAEQMDGFVPETQHPLVNPDLIANGDVAQRLLLLYGSNRSAS